MQPGSEKKPLAHPIVIRPLAEADLDAADHVMRVAFGTFIGIPQPATFMGDAGFVRHRWRMDPSAAFAAQVGDELVGSIFAARWGSVGFFGPLTVRPDLWDAGIGRKLMEPVLARFAEWRLTHAGLFTFAQSPKHVGFYQSLGFWPRYLTAVLARPIWTAPAAFVLFSTLNEAERARRLDELRNVAATLYPGLDLTSEIEAARRLSLGDTVIVDEGGEAVGFAVCHIGPQTEAGSGNCYVKFGAARAGAGAASRFERLLDACSALADARGARNLIAGTNTARREAYRALLARGFRTVLQGVTMHKPDEPGYSRSELFVIDDWR